MPDKNRPGSASGVPPEAQLPRLGENQAEGVGAASLDVQPPSSDGNQFQPNGLTGRQAQRPRPGDGRPQRPPDTERRSPPSDEHGGETAAHRGIRLDFSISLNPLGLPAAVKEAVAGCADALAAYPDPACRELRRVLARRCRVSPEQILCGNGATDLLYRLCAAVKPGRVLTVAPAFSEYERSARLGGAEVSRHRLNPAAGFAVGDDFAAAITPDVDMVFCCQPNNPTGRLVAPATLARIVERARLAKATLVLDECFLPFAEAPSLIPTAAAEPHVIVLRAFTKSHSLAGLRLGYAVGDPALLAAMAACGPRWNVSVIAQLAGLAALADSAWEERSRRFVARERAWLSAELACLGLSVIPSDANFILFQSAASLFQPLLSYGILIRSCANFPGLDATWQRVGVKTRADNQTLIDALAEVLHG
ncbi:MAG: threonine-phosphate decarboxylase CobD [Propionibacteriaceae bacterium]|jgi:threonine-phosphate decarboxylase|nr:threonine-phosphate decarboxylase CobD [Propionibacteriaceae bacterium]